MAATQEERLRLEAKNYIIRNNYDIQSYLKTLNVTELIIQVWSDAKRNFLEKDLEKLLNEDEDLKERLIEEGVEKKIQEDSLDVIGKIDVKNI